MKLPNGYGSVYKLSGKRRRPWAARKTVGWTFNKDSGTSYPIYKFIGYYETKKEALAALALYNEDPYLAELNEITLEDLYNKWSNDHFETVKKSTYYSYTAAWKVLFPIKHMKIKDIKLVHIQQVFDDSGKYETTLDNVKIILKLMYGFGVKNELVSANKRDYLQYLNTQKAGNPHTIDRIPFNKSEIEELWNRSDEDMVKIALILIYTGMRKGELIGMMREHVHLDERYMDVVDAKTAAGIRQVPIAERIAPFIQYFLEKGNVFLICNPQSRRFNHTTFRRFWIDQIGAEHRPHDARHTFVSLATEKGIDKRVIQEMVGHKDSSVTNIYTHISLKSKLSAVNKL